MNEEHFSKGAIVDLPDDRDIQFSGIAMASSPYDWSTEYDIEKELGNTLSNTTFRIVSKDQGPSSSCGGQAWAYLGAVLEAFATKTYEERSAKFIYSTTHVPSGGSAGRTNSDFVINNGWGKEELCISYENGKPPSEEFMQRLSDVSEDAKKDAKKAKGLIYANVAIDIDLCAQAIRDNKGMILGVYGFNNGTWNSAFPKPPAVKSGYWAHWVYAGKVKMVDGKKYIGIKNSWSDRVGEQGWQWLGEEYFKPSFMWSGWTMVYKGEDPAFKYNFFFILREGAKGPEVEALQKALTLEGLFKGKIDGHFGPITKAAVKNFQSRYSLGSDGIVGPKTNEKLNSLYNK